MAPSSKVEVGGSYADDRFESSVSVPNGANQPFISEETLKVVD